MISSIGRATHEAESAGDSGQALVEYALVLILIAFVTFLALQTIGTSVSGAINNAVAGFGGG